MSDKVNDLKTAAILNVLSEDGYDKAIAIPDIQIDQIRRLQSKGDILRLVLGEYNTDAIKELYDLQDNPDYLVDVIICVKRNEL